ncbi:MAG: hypothetical protein D3923_06700 [Candidatus Electrothrix sp. AR3]|nr:hypothetical protein [Candidatus Electrothrix sp. AR3]
MATNLRRDSSVGWDELANPNITHAFICVGVRALPQPTQLLSLNRLDLFGKVRCRATIVHDAAQRLQKDLKEIDDDMQAGSHTEEKNEKGQAYRRPAL